MIQYTEALAEVLKHTSILKPKKLALNEMLGRGLAEPVIAPFDQPRFDNSAVDGFAVKVNDLIGATEEKPIVLRLKDTLKAGAYHATSLSSGETIKVFTGSIIPPGAEAVVMREFCLEQGDIIKVGAEISNNENIRLHGGDFRAGQQILQSGIRITPPLIGLLASLGYSHYMVGDKPKVAIIITGDEIVIPGGQLLPAQIYDSNSFSIGSALAALGLNEYSCSYVLDRYIELKEVYKKALDNADIVISSGGISVGDFDFVKQVLCELNVKTIFHQVAIKPGRPLYFGTIKAQRAEQNKLVFALPGNVISTLITFHQFVKPAIFKMMSIEPQKKKVMKATVDKAIKKPAGRLEFVRATLSSHENGGIYALPSNIRESHMLSGLATEDTLIHFLAEDTKLDAGSIALVENISWFE